MTPQSPAAPHTRRQTRACLTRVALVLLGSLASPSALAQPMPAAPPALSPSALAPPLTPPAPAVTGAILLDETTVAAMALRTHPSVDASRAALGAARAAATGADLARIPELDLSARYTRLSRIPAEYTTLGGLVFPQLLDSLGARAQLTLQLTDTFLGLAATARAAGHDASAAALKLVATRAQVAYDARLAFLDYWSRSLALVNATELLRAAESNATDQRRRKATGTVAPNDVLPFETALDDAAMNLERARGDLAAAEATLRIYIPDLVGKPLAVRPLPSIPEGAPPPATPKPTTMPPRLAALEHQARAADARTDSASLSRLPRLTLYGAADISAPSPRVFVLDRLVAIPTWEVGARLEWSLSQATVGSARTAQARHEHRALVARLAAARLTLDAEREATRRLLEAAHARLQRARDRVDHATELAHARRGELDAGTALPLDVVLAETDLVRARNEHIAAHVERAMSRAKLDFLDGRTDFTPPNARPNAPPKGTP
ncbi:TolC family protein [Chondromyces crocatus]|uniref:Outer membrane efflux protein n=1 Tax=Chondromyces crocatus TaxID=52 RepID=A0A0K1EL11_CHOCO|nr:TolC family protein [Chondromyces crocatus]AKT41347.1 uncharacterized protein CMC5_055460 [Chondromyces crocatus]